MMNRAFQMIVKSGNDYICHLAIIFSINNSDPKFFEIPKNIIDSLITKSSMHPDIISYIISSKKAIKSIKMDNILSIKQLYDCGKTHSPALLLLLDMSLDEKQVVELIDNDQCIWDYPYSFVNAEDQSYIGKFYIRLITQILNHNIAHKNKFLRKEKVLRLLGKLMKNSDIQLALDICQLIKTFFKFYDTQEDKDILFKNSFSVLESKDIHFIQSIVSSVIEPISSGKIYDGSYSIMNNRLDKAIGNVFLTIHYMMLSLKHDKFTKIFDHINAFVNKRFSKSMHTIVLIILKGVESYEIRRKLRNTDVIENLDKIKKTSIEKNIVEIQRRLCSFE
jgi:hypothetical protein